MKINIKNSFLIITSIVLIFSSEIFFRYLYDLRMDKASDSLIFISAFIVSLYFIKSRVISVIVLCYVIFSYASQMINMSIYGYWLPPINIVLAVEKFGETLRSGQDSFGQIILTLILISSISIVLLIIRLNKSKRTSYYYDAIIMLLIIIQPIKVYTSPSSTQGENPSSRYSAIKAGYYANSYLLGRILPNMITKKEYYKAYQADIPSHNPSQKINNIILVMGESLNTKNISAFSYGRETTPWLNNQRHKEKGIVKEVYASGTFTDITLPSFFNMIPTPNGDKQIATRNTNLFRMAKENGYTTHFHSAQDNDGLTLMNKVGLESIDHYTTSSALGYDNYTAAYDTEIINYLNYIDFSKPNFIVLHQIGSHSPYTKRVPEDFKPFGSGNYQNDYDNTVLFTDQFLEKIMIKLKSKIPNNDWLLIFTSDHGQTVSTTAMGHGSLELESNYVVPALITSNSIKIKKEYNKLFINCDRIFHYQLSTYIGKSLGFDINIPNCERGIVNGSRMNGSAGYLEIK